MCVKYCTGHRFLAKCAGTCSQRKEVFQNPRTDPQALVLILSLFYKIFPSPFYCQGGPKTCGLSVNLLFAF